ncbi:helix-turn-helix domain-containing protein [Rhodococcus fascians]|nr:helix-turn-helix domain-containing protein [Rhodococcus fascians]
MDCYVRVFRMSRRPLEGFEPSRLLEARLNKGFSQGELALRASVSSASISAWEVGRSTPQVDRLRRVADVLGLEMAELIHIPETELKLANLRELAGWTQAQLAQRAGMSTPLLAALERGHASLTDAVCARVAAQLKLPDAAVAEAFERGRTRQ